MSPHRGQQPGGPAEESHPAAEELTGAAEGTLAGARAARVRRHLESCAECREVVADLASYPDLESPGPEWEVQDEERRTVVGELRRRLLLDEISSPGAGAVVEEPAAEVRPFRLPAEPSGNRALPWLAAAAMLLMLVGWGYRELSFRDLRDRLAVAEARLAEAAAERLRPRVNVDIVQLMERANPLRSPVAPRSLGSSGLTTVIQRTDPLPPGRYAVELTGTEGAHALTIEGLEPQPEGLTIYLPPGSLAPGHYTVRILSDDGEALPGAWDLEIAG